MSLITGDAVVEWVAPRAVGPHFAFEKPTMGIGWQRDGEIVAGIAYTNYNPRNVDMHVALTKGSVTRELWRTVFDYPFNQLKVERVTGVFPEGNKATKRLVEHLEFVLETTLKDAHPSGDMLVYVMRRHQCRWLRDLYKTRVALAA